MVKQPKLNKFIIKEIAREIGYSYEKEFHQALLTVLQEQLDLDTMESAFRKISHIQRVKVLTDERQGGISQKTWQEIKEKFEKKNPSNFFEFRKEGSNFIVTYSICDCCKK